MVTITLTDAKTREEYYDREVRPTLERLFPEGMEPDGDPLEVVDAVLDDLDVEDEELRTWICEEIVAGLT
jgi:hypothetical protein